MLNKKIDTRLIKEIKKRYTDAADMYQKIWIHGTELYMDETDEPAITENEVEFLRFAYSVIKARGENVESFTEDELFQIHTMLISAIMLNRDDIILSAGISKGFLGVVENKLKQLGFDFD